MNARALSRFTRHDEHGMVNHCRASSLPPTRK